MSTLISTNQHRKFVRLTRKCQHVQGCTKRGYRWQKDGTTRYFCEKHKAYYGGLLWQQASMYEREMPHA